MNGLTGNSAVRRSLQWCAGIGVLLTGIASIVGSGSDNGADDAPWAVDEAISIKQDQVAEFDVAFIRDSTGSYTVNDLGAEPSTVTLTNPAHGTAEVDGSVVTYTPDAGYIGADTFDYTITDSNGAADSGQIIMVVTNLMPSPRQVAVDSANNRALVTDDVLKAVVNVDLATGARTYFSDPVTPDAANPFSAPNGIAIDMTNNRALVTDIFLDAVIAVDLTTGARAVLSDAATPDALNAFVSPDGIAIDELDGRNRALVVDSGLGGVIAVDLDSGARTILSDATIPNDENAFGTPTGIAIDTANGRALVTDRDLAAVVAVDLLTGARTILSDATTPDSSFIFFEPDGIVVDAANDRALVAASQQSAVLSVDLTTGERSILSSSLVPNSENRFDRPGAMALDAAGDRVIVVDVDDDFIFDINTGNVQARIVAVDLAEDDDTDIGQRTPLPDSFALFTGNLLVDPLGMAIDAPRNRALVTDAERNAVISVAAENGEQEILSDTGNPNEENPFDGPLGIVVDEAGERALVVDQTLDTLLDVDFATDGERVVLSNATTPDEQNPFGLPGYIALDLAGNRNRALVTDQSLDAVIGVDLDTGSRMIVSDSQTPDTENVFAVPGAIAVDAAYEYALVIDPNLRAVLEVSLETGQRTILSDPETPDELNPFDTPSGILLDLPNNRALVVDGALASVIAVDLDTGARTVLSDALTGVGSQLSTPLDITAGFAANQFLVLDRELRAVLVVSGTDGDRAIMSR